MEDCVSIQDVQQQLRAAFGREIQYEHLWRWRLTSRGVRSLDLWLDSSHDGHACELWMSHPDDDVPCRLEIHSEQGLEALIARVREAIDSGQPPPLPQLTAGLPALDGTGQLLRWRSARAGG